MLYDTTRVSKFSVKLQDIGGGLIVRALTPPSGGLRAGLSLTKFPADLSHTPNRFRRYMVRLPIG